MQKGVNAYAAYTELLAFNIVEKAFLFLGNNKEKFHFARHAIEITVDSMNLGLDIEE